MNSPASAGEAASLAWNTRRVDLAIALCAATAPDFAGFDRAARGRGFSRAANGYYGLGRTEIVASLSGAGGGCVCRLSFGTEASASAATLFAQRMVNRFGARFQPDADPHSLGTLSTTAGLLPVTVVRFQRAGADWIGILVNGKSACPAARNASLASNPSPTLL